MAIKKGDYVRTPRFLRVKIQKVFRNAENARASGYTESTDYNNPEYGIKGKVIGENRMHFAAYKK